MMIKSELRELTQNNIDALPDEYIFKSNAGILKNMLSLREYKDAKSVMLFYSVGREPDTLLLAEAAFADNKKVAFPFCLRKGIMHAHVVSSPDELRPAMLGIPAPPEDAPVLSPYELDLIIVPALTYDRDGFRLGYGGGYYDRYLADTSAFTVGIARERLLMDKVLREPHDIAVRRLVTEKEVYNCPTM